MAKDLQKSAALDVCNGHMDQVRGYHYHITPGRFPYILGGYAGVVEPSNNRGLHGAQKGAIVDNTQYRENRLDNAIASVRPGTASRGNTHRLQFEIDPKKARRSIPNGVPTWVQVGPFEAKTITREGNIITAEIDVPDESSLGVLFDCHIEFASNDGRGVPIVFKKNEVFRVVE